METTIYIFDEVTYVSRYVSRHFLSGAAYKRGLGSAIHDSDRSVIRRDMRFRFWNNESENSTYGGRIGPTDDHIPFPLLFPEPVENLLQPDHRVSLTFPRIAPTSPDSRETALCISAFSDACRDMPTKICRERPLNGQV